LQGFRASFDRFFPYHPPRERDPRFFFLFQYTHARCRALLRLGEREGILLDEEDSPSRFPLSPFHPAERALFWQLLTVVDRAGTGKALSLARDFCESILDLDRFCRIVGEPAAVARSRLRLISASQRLLRVFLAERLAQVPREDL
jgi:arginyl-tRNA synthetase